MSYVVLARKHRPDTFDSVIGQSHVTGILAKAVESGRIAHSYLFCGPRGIGKTSCARIFAKCLNCEKGPTTDPCGKCSICTEISKANSFDVLEIDGASNRGIDEIRTLRENVKFAPSSGKYKIYIIDEVHMLTTEAFNALLKTLEEPPEHVKFIFATTDPNKVPATIISRCQRFDFKRIPLKTIVEALSDISKKEKFKIDEDALYAIAKAAQGSLRDALSVLDQLSGLSQKGIDSDDVFSMLGMVETSLIFEIVDALGAKNCANALERLEVITDKGKDIKQLVRDLIEHFRNLMVIKIGGKVLGKLIDYPIAIKELYLKQCELFTMPEILKAIDLFIEAQETARVTESHRIPLEVAFARLAYSESNQFNAPQPSLPDQKKPSRATTVLKDEKGQVAISANGHNDQDESAIIIKDKVKVELPEKSEDTSEPDSVIDPSTLSLSRIKESWDELTFAVSREKMSTATYLQEGVAYAFQGEELVIAFSKDCSFHKETLESESNVQLVEKTFNDQLKTNLRIKYIIAEEDMTNDEVEHVQSAINVFGGEVVDRWHNDE